MNSTGLVKLLALGGLTFALLALLALMPGTDQRTASATANPLPPLLSCPNVDGSDNHKVTVADILSVVKKFPKSYGQAGYGALWDLVSPYNSTSPVGTGAITVSDIIAVVQKYNVTCPLVDTQIARGTRAIGDPLYMDILCDPALTTPVNCGGDAQFLTENASFLATKGYFQASSNVPGQGVHYFAPNNWDGVFNPTRPEGLVYDNGPEDPMHANAGSCSDNVDNGGDGVKDGNDPDCQVFRLAAHLYVIKGDGVGGVTWGSYAAGPCGGDPYTCPGAEHGINLESAPGPNCSPACSWDGTYDGWHVHYYLCTVHIGHTVALAIPGSIAPTVGDTQEHCEDYAAIGGSDTPCPVPMTSADVPCYTWGKEIGWMGHLWNWLPNANLIPDIGTSGQNGRFADCYPDSAGWGPFDCPA